MKTLRYKKDDNVPPIYENPFVLYSKNVRMIFPNHVYTISTGINIFSIKDSCLKVVDIIHEKLNVLTVFVRNDEIYLTVCMFGSDDICIVKENDPIVRVAIVDNIIDTIRFIEIFEGKRRIIGNISSVKID